MKTMNTLLKATLLVLICVGIALDSSGANWSKALKEALEAKYQLAKVGWDQTRITKPGTVLVVQKDGIYEETSDAFNIMETKVINGEVQAPKGFVAAMSSSSKNRELKVGDTVYVRGIMVTGRDLLLELITCDTSAINAGGTTRNIRYGANISFIFPQGFLETSNAEAITKVIDGVLLPQAEAQAAKTKTVELGQTPDQVKDILGAPDKVVKLGPKEIFVYKDMKVIFEDGKVSDVQ